MSTYRERGGPGLQSTVHSEHGTSEVMAGHVSRGVKRAGDMRQEKQESTVGWRYVFGSQ